EQKVVQYVLSVIKKSGFEYEQDSFGNILVRKPATPGYENRKTVCLQGHLDMVCEKNSDVQHDFENDPIQPYVDGDWVKAKGTTLGADNGIGVAAALAVMEAKDLQHGPLEFLFTLDEETGLTGASNLKPGFVKADILLNLDSEEDGSFYIGCSGGKDTEGTFTYKKENVPDNSISYKVKVTGLKGGHSGLDIHLGRGNAIKILTRLLWNLQNQFDIRLSKIEGGSKRNAIPREAFAELVVAKNKADELEGFINYFNTLVKSENSTVEPNLKVDFEKSELPQFVIDKLTQINLLNALYALPHGVIKMSPDLPGLVETSTNLATISFNDEIVVGTSQRSSVESEKEDVVVMNRAVFLLANAKVKHGEGYPGWKPDVNSEILKVMKEVYKNLYQKEPEVKAIHAGLECGIIKEKNPDMDMISFGPTIMGAHSPDEKVQISTVQKFYDLLIEVLKNIPVKN
ncbi:MAG: aminoacyl-histidine dipeptidase, partial [Ignavibacteria bacterium]